MVVYSAEIIHDVTLWRVDLINLTPFMHMPSLINLFKDPIFMSQFIELVDISPYYHYYHPSFFHDFDRDLLDRSCCCFSEGPPNYKVLNIDLNLFCKSQRALLYYTGAPVHYTG